MLLVLAVDVSRSVTEPKFRLQREGTAAAITDPDVVKAITSGPNRRIAVCFVEWATVGMQTVVVDWTVIDGTAAARNFGDKLIEAPRSFAGSTSISGAIDFSVRQLERAPLHVGAARHRHLRRRQQQLRPLGHRRPRRGASPRAS